MKKDYTHIGMLLDRSFSMLGLKSAVIEGVNGLIEDQRTGKGTCTLSLVQFDYSPFTKKNKDVFNASFRTDSASNFETGYLQVCSFADIKFAPKLDESNYVPRGNTAYLDALGKMISDTGEYLSNLPEDQRPDKVVIFVYTDGEENSSIKYTKSDIKALIKHQEEKYGWQFMFLGANMDAVAEGESLGINVANSVTFNATDMQAVKCSVMAASSNLRSYRSTGDIKSLNYTEEQRSILEGKEGKSLWKSRS